MFEYSFGFILLFMSFGISLNYEELLDEFNLSERPGKKSQQLRNFIEDVNRANSDLSWIRQAASAVNPNLAQISFRTPANLEVLHNRLPNENTRSRRQTSQTLHMIVPQDDYPSDSDNDMFAKGINLKIMSRTGRIDREDTDTLDKPVWRSEPYAGSVPVPLSHPEETDYDVSGNGNENDIVWNIELHKRDNYPVDDLREGAIMNENYDMNVQNNDIANEIDESAGMPKFDYSHSFGFGDGDKKSYGNDMFGSLDHKTIVKRHLNPENEINLKISAKLYSKGYRSPLPSDMFKDIGHNDKKSNDLWFEDQEEQIAEQGSISDGENYNEYLGASRYRTRSLKSVDESNSDQVFPASMFDHHNAPIDITPEDKVIFDKTNDFQNTFMKLDDYDISVKNNNYKPGRTYTPDHFVSDILLTTNPDLEISRVIHDSFPAANSGNVHVHGTADSQQVASPLAELRYEDKDPDEQRLTDEGTPIPLSKSRIHTRSGTLHKNDTTNKTNNNNMTDLDKTLSETDGSDIMNVTCGHNDVSTIEPSSVVTKPKRTEKEEELEIKESMHGQLPRRLMTAVINMIQSNNVLKGYLGPGMTKKLAYGKMTLGQRVSSQNIENVAEVRKMEMMLRQVMSVLNRIVEEQVRLRTCIGPRSELIVFLQWMLHHDTDLGESSNYLEEGGMPLPSLRRPDTQRSSTQDPFLFPDAVNIPDHEDAGPDTLQKKIALVRRLIAEYENLSERDKIQVHDIHDYLYKHLDLLLHLLGQEVKLKSFTGSNTTVTEGAVTGEKQKNVSTSNSTQPSTTGPGTGSNISMSSPEPKTTSMETKVTSTSTNATSHSSTVTSSYTSQNKPASGPAFVPDKDRLEDADTKNSKSKISERYEKLTNTANLYRRKRVSVPEQIMSSDIHKASAYDSSAVATEDETDVLTPVVLLHDSDPNTNPSSLNKHEDSIHSNDKNLLPL